MTAKEPHGDDPPTWPTPFDWPHEIAIRDLRFALVRHPLVKDALFALGVIGAPVTDPDGRHIPAMAPVLTAVRYWACLDLTTAALGAFSAQEVHTLGWRRVQVSTSYTWGGLLPRGHGAGDHGRQGKRQGRLYSPATIELATEMIARRLDARRRGISTERLDLDVGDDLGYSAAAARQAVSRLTRLGAAHPPSTAGTSDRTARRRARQQREAAAAGRGRLDLEVAAGHLRRWTQADCDMAGEAMGMPGVLGTLDPDCWIYVPLDGA